MCRLFGGGNLQLSEAHSGARGSEQRAGKRMANLGASHHCSTMSLTHLKRQERTAEVKDRMEASNKRSKTDGFGGIAWVVFDMPALHSVSVFFFAFSPQICPFV